MDSLQGYYSLIQYSEFPERIEYVNIGVCLFTAVLPHVLVKFSDSPRRAEKAFDVDLGTHFRLMKESIENRLRVEFSESWDRDSIDRFIAMRSGKVRLSPKLSILIDEPNAIIDDLYNRLVTEYPKRIRNESVKVKLKKNLQFMEVEALLERPEPVVLPQGLTIHAPYAYQNGAYNLICPISLRGEPNSAIQNAGRYALEGKWLYEFSKSQKQKKMIIVGDMDGQQEDFSTAIEDVMKENNIGFYRLGSISELAADIRKNAQIHISQ
jgi:Protein of unknown function (DUF3037)